MKIAIIGSRGYPYVYSGYETFVKELSERLVKSGIHVTVYCHKNLFNETPRSLNGIHLKYIYTIERKTLSQFIHSFQSIIHSLFCSYDIVFVVNSANGPFGLITKLFRIKTVINVDGLEWLRPKWSGLGAKYFYWASKMATRFFNVIVNDSFEMRNYYIREFNRDSEVIAYGAAIRYSKKSEKIRKWDLVSREYFLVVGRLIPDNNGELIVNEFIKSNSDKKLVIVGDVPYNDNYAKRIKNIKDPRIIFTGYVTDQDDLAELYINCFAYLHGHEFGGTNPTMLMALGCGSAILALDTAFNKEMLDYDKYGMYFNKEQDNLKQLIEKVELHPTELNLYREKSRERIVNNYTWEKITEQYILLFNRIIKANPAE